MNIGERIEALVMTVELPARDMEALRAEQDGENIRAFGPYRRDSRTWAEHVRRTATGIK